MMVLHLVRGAEDKDATSDGPVALVHLPEFATQNCRTTRARRLDISQTPRTDRRVCTRPVSSGRAHPDGPTQFFRWLAYCDFQEKESEMATIDDGEKWAAMHADWQAVNQEARTARIRVTQAFERAAAGSGSGPTTAQLELAETLEVAADEKRLAMDEFVKEAFG